jgi:prephenate dehydrogenase
MSAQITIIGLGQIGASIGLALAGQKSALKRVGHDKKPGLERSAQSSAVDEGNHHRCPLREYYRALPVSQVRETLELIASELKEGAVVIDTAPVKSAVAEWARELIPRGRHYIGLVPALNPEVLHETKLGQDAARADLFQKGLMVINAPPGTPGEVVQLATDLARLLGATALLADMAESDGLVARMHLLPQLVAAALLNTTVDQPGWQEARKVAAVCAAVTAGLAYQDEIDLLRVSALQDRANIVHARCDDRFCAACDDIESGDEDGVAACPEQA